MISYVCKNSSLCERVWLHYRVKLLDSVVDSVFILFWISDSRTRMNINYPSALNDPFTQASWPLRSLPFFSLSQSGGDLKPKEDNQTFSENPEACITKRAQLFLGYSDLSSLTNLVNGDQDNRYHDADYQHGNSTQVCLIKSREHACVRGGFRGSRPITIMSAKQTEKRTATERAPYSSCGAAEIDFIKIQGREKQQYGKI